jgi:hypothetical protein
MYLYNKLVRHIISVNYIKCYEDYKNPLLSNIFCDRQSVLDLFLLAFIRENSQILLK